MNTKPAASLGICNHALIKRRAHEISATYLAAGTTDLRQGFEGLYGLVRHRLGLEPRTGHLFLFSNRNRNRLKVLFWDGSGLWVCTKRLERGRFSWPEPEASTACVTLGAEEFALLVGGIDLSQTRRKNWYRKAA